VQSIDGSYRNDVTKMQKNTVALVAFALIFSLAALPIYAKLADDLNDLVGYTITASKTINRWYDDERGNDTFEGCDHGRVIVFDDNTSLTCAEYGYQYVYRPTAIILTRKITAKGKSFYDIRMVVGDKVYNMRR
jgi:hypothetical protein